MLHVYENISKQEKVNMVVERIIEYFLETQTKLSELREANTMKEAYHQAQESTEKVKRRVGDILLSLALPPDSRCENCEQWFQRR